MASGDGQERSSSSHPMTRPVSNAFPPRDVGKPLDLSSLANSYGTSTAYNQSGPYKKIDYIIYKQKVLMVVVVSNTKLLVGHAKLSCRKLMEG